MQAPHCLVPISKMAGHDHSLRKLYSIEGLSNPDMVLNWICPVGLKEDCPYEVIARIFTEYFAETNCTNTNEEFLNLDGQLHSFQNPTGLH